MALERYERHLPFSEHRVVAPDGFRFETLEIAQVGMLRDGSRREERMVRDLEFDIAELSLSSYVMAKSQGRPLTAVPVFPRRLFSQTQMFVRTDSPLRSPHDLVGRRVGIQSLQATLAVVAKGDLAFEYGVPWRSVTWVVRDRETVALPSEIDADIVRVPRDADLPGMLASGELDALFYSRYPHSPQVSAGSVRRLFADPQAEALRYYRKYGAYPIMHVLALKQDSVNAHPSLPGALQSFFSDALRDCHDNYADPGWSLLPFGRLAYEEMLAQFGGDPWRNGIAANRAFLERFIDYAHDQQLIAERLPVDALFVEGGAPSK
jgi:4,5-dihydroxyphthalate decarboxylase